MSEVVNRPGGATAGAGDGPYVIRHMRGSLLVLGARG